MATRNNTAAIVAPVATPQAYVGKYHAAPKAVNTKAVTYTLTAWGNTCAANGGVTGGRGVTVMGLVAIAATHVAAKGQPLTGANIVAAMRVLPAVRTAYAATKAGAGYANGVPCKAWCSGYVNGAAGKATGILARA